MNAASSSSLQTGHFEQLQFARDIIRAEGETLLQLAAGLDASFCEAVALVFGCQGSVIVSGMGKAGWIGQKISATLASTDTRSHFLHPAEAIHGDLGRIRDDDVILILSQSGQTEEVIGLLPSLAEFGVPIIAVTGRPDSSLASAATVTIDLGRIEEACPLGLAPSASTTAMLAVGDALALVTSRLRGFRREDFARYHPGGSLGVKLSRVEKHMRPLAECRVAQQSKTVREVFASQRRSGRRSGAVMLLDEQGRLAGVFTDSDLARLLENVNDAALDRPVADVMTAGPLTVRVGSMLTEAVSLMAGRKISELPVLSDDERPVGMIDITDVVGLFPKDHFTQLAQNESSGQPRAATLPFPKPSRNRRRKAT